MSLCKEQHCCITPSNNLNLGDVISHIENGRGEGEKRENEISQVINGREELLLLLFSTTVAVAVRVCNALRDGEEPKLSSLFMNYNYLKVFKTWTPFCSPLS